MDHTRVADLDFDEVTERSPWLRTMAKWRVPPPGVIPLWVADMDFRPPVAVREALYGYASGSLGYPDWPDHASPLRECFVERMVDRYSWEPGVEAVREFTNVTQGVLVALAAATEPGDEVLIHVPTFGPMLDVLKELNLVPLWIPMVQVGGGWAPDPNALHAAAARPRAKALLLVNPHNPTGRVFSRLELAEMLEAAERNNLMVVADEVHADLVYSGAAHIPFASQPGAEERTVTLTSASKAFNLAALRCAVAHFGPTSLLASIDHGTRLKSGLVSPLGVVATMAAWSPETLDWQRRLMAYLNSNLDYLDAFARSSLPGVSFIRPEGTYLAWLDFLDARLGEDPATYFLREAGVMLSPGDEFGPGGHGHARLNVATSRRVLDLALRRIASATHSALPAAG